MGLDKDLVQHLETLARLKLPPEQSAQLVQDLQAILGHVTALQGVDVSQVEPMTHAVPASQPLREDAVQPPLGPPGLEGSAGWEAPFVKVPRIVE